QSGEHSHMFRAFARGLRGHKRNSKPFRPTLESLEGRLVPSNNPNLIVPAYNSLPGAKATLYLDFNGDTTAAWGAYSNIDTPAYDTDGNANSFSAAELTNIQQIWARVAERYAPFNINVTTVAPTTMVKGIDMQIDIGGDCMWTGVSCGGISYVGSFVSPNVPSLSFVFSKYLGNGTPSYVG